MRRDPKSALFAILATGSALLALLLVFWLVPVAAGIDLDVRTVRASSTYSVGETVQFRIAIEREGRAVDFGSINYRLSEDGYRVIDEATLGLTGEELTVERALDRPGFLRLEVRHLDGAGTETRAAAAAGIDPLQIRPSREAPIDFDAFWDSQRQRLADEPLQWTSRPVGGEGTRADELIAEGLVVEDVQIACLEGAPASGYFARPSEPAPGSLPAVLWVHRAGVRSADLNRAAEGAARGFLSFDLNAHGVPNGREAAYYQLLAEEELEDYRYDGRENRDGSYFLGMFLRLLRAIDFLAAQEAWDGRTLAVIGHSQGGAQALVAGGLDRRVSFVGAGVPALCDHTGMLRRRVSGWPRLVPILEDGKPDPVIAEVARYFDAVHFASRCHAEAIVSVGFIDAICPPTTVYAAFNELRGEKRLLARPRMGHSAPVEVQKVFLEAIEQHAARPREAVED